MERARFLLCAGLLICLASSSLAAVDGYPLPSLDDPDASKEADATNANSISNNYLTQLDDSERPPVSEKKELSSLATYNILVPGPSSRVVPASGALEPSSTNSSSIAEAVEHVRTRVNEARAKCKQPLYTSANATYAISQPGEGTNYVLEIALSYKNHTQLYQTAIHHIPGFQGLFHASTDKKIDWEMYGISPDPCKPERLAATFLETSQHNSNPERTWDATVYLRHFGKGLSELNDLGFILPCT